MSNDEDIQEDIEKNMANGTTRLYTRYKGRLFTLLLCASWCLVISHAVSINKDASIRMAVLKIHNNDIIGFYIARSDSGVYSRRCSKHHATHLSTRAAEPGLPSQRSHASWCCGHQNLRPPKLTIIALLGFILRAMTRLFRKILRRIL
ncbi:hypothetical protein F4774DRAFT_87236 [Daldinia eschscholtzii]|nr:hypothetical protein F4774DRAFT_87236 [Daldinia eschscholtzii]